MKKNDKSKNIEIMCQNISFKYFKQLLQEKAKKKTIKCS